MKKKLVKVLSLLLTSVMLGTSVNLGAYAEEMNVEEIVAEESDYGISNPRIEGFSTTWDCIYFGNYYQNEYNPENPPKEPLVGAAYTDKDGTVYTYVDAGAWFYDEETEEDYWEKDYKYISYEPIIWRVLNVTGNDAFLLADMCLDGKLYNTSRTDVTWETCTLRSWLNGYGAASNICEEDYTDNGFIDIAFNESEKTAINDTEVVNDDNPVYDTAGGNNTSDKIFLLSIDEVENDSYGFNEYNKALISYPTLYADSQLEYFYNDVSYIWWLRSPGYVSHDASIVDSDGRVYRSGHNVSRTDNAVRPALHLNLSSSSVWKYAGTVNSDYSGAEHLVTFDANGGSCDTPSMTVIEGSRYGELPKATCTDMCFAGWFTESDGGSRITSTDTVDITEDITLYAHWNDSHGELVLRDVVAPTCVDDGYTGDIACSVCGEIITIGSVDPATDIHKADVIIPAIAATCVKDGSTEGKKCSVCEKVVEEPKTISANGIHTWVNNDSKPASCTEDGYEGGQHCKNCTATQGEVKTSPKLGHDFDKEGTVTKEPTLRAEGERTHKCSRCDASEKKPIAKLVEEGKEVVGTPETKTNEDGSVTTVEKHTDETVREKTSLELTVTGDAKTKAQLVVDKDSSNKITNTEVKVETSGKPEFTPELVKAVKDMVADKTATTAKKANPDITLVTKDAAGNEYNITAKAKDLKKNAKLSVFAIDPVTGKIILTSEAKLKCDKKGGLEAPSLNGDKDYKLLSTKDANKALKDIKKTIVLNEKTGEAVASGSYIIKLKDGYNPVNVKDIDYSISSKKGSVDKATGTVTLDPKVTKGSVSVKVTVELVDGSKVKLTQKIRIKK